MTPGTESSRAADELFADFLARLEGGESVDFEEWVKDHPDEEALLRERHAGWLLVRSKVKRAVGAFLHRRVDSGSDSTVTIPAVHPGSEVGDFRLLRHIGSGGMGQVWEAEQRSLHRSVALKLLPSSVVASERLLRRFEREAEAGARLNHPNIVSVYTYGRDAEQPYIAQELIEDGCTLADSITALKAEAELPSDYFRLTAEFVIQVAEALQVAHDAGVIHRDIKPSNILVTTDDEPKVADFGLAQIVESEPLSQTGEIVGTYSYMSPEQTASHRLDVDSRTDVFSLGATLYELLTLERAFGGDSGKEIAEKILHVDPPDPRGVRPNVPFELAVICLKALEKRPAERFQSMRELAEELGRFPRDEPIRTTPTSAAQRVRKWLRRHPTTTVASLVALVAVLVIVPLGLVSLSNAHERERAERERQLLVLDVLVEKGDMKRAQSLVEASLAGAGPLPHLKLAAGYARLKMSDRAREQIQAAEAKGASDDPPELNASGEELFHHALYLSATQADGALQAATKYLERAIAQEDAPVPAFYALFTTRGSLQDNEGARDALSEFRRRIPANDPMHAFVSVQLLELEGEYDEAVQRLEEFAQRPDVDPAEMLLDRDFGRLYRKLRDHDRAASSLQRAVEVWPEDSWSWSNRAKLACDRAEEEADFQPKMDWLDEADRFALEALEHSPGMVGPSQVLAHTAYRRIEQRRRARETIPAAAWTKAASAIEALAIVSPDDPCVDLVSAQVAYERAIAALREGAFQSAEDHFNECLAVHPGHAKASLALVNLLWPKGEFDRMLKILDDARSNWEASAAQPPRWFAIRAHRSQLQQILVWSFGAAVSANDANRTVDALEAIRRELERGQLPDDETAFNLAEFLITAPEELSDLELACDVYSRHDLDKAFGDYPEAKPILQALADICR